MKPKLRDMGRSKKMVGPMISTVNVKKSTCEFSNNIFKTL